MPSLVRAQSLRGYHELVADLGGDPDRLLRAAGVDPAALNQLTAFIGFEALVELLERSAAELRCPDFGLRLAERQDIGILDTLAVAMRHSATVGEAMGCGSRYLEIHNHAVAFTPRVDESRGQIFMAFHTIVDHAPRWAQTAEHGLGLAWRIMTLLSEGRAHLQQVLLSHPPVAAATDYEHRFGVPVTFGADQLALVYRVTDLDLAVTESNRELHDLAASYLERQLPADRTSTAMQVRHAVEAFLGTGTCSCRHVANALFMHPRTLQRRLHEEDATFESIRDDTRRDLARRYLGQADLPLAQVAALLDYREQSALGRSCRRWFHATPLQVRAGLISEPPSPAPAPASRVSVSGSASDPASRLVSRR
jgi:AraC-like DNA-binding protein